VQETAGQAPPAGGHIPLSPEVKTVLELSQQLAQELGDDRTGTAHLLLVLIRDREGAAARVLTRLGGDLARIRQQVIKLHASPAATSNPAAATTTTSAASASTAPGRSISGSSGPG
jgi:ATP-dependent Clp protease ATP-binding subunit ClpC